MAIELTTEQEVEVSVVVADGRGRHVATDGMPIVTVSDPTVVSVTSPALEGDAWKFEIVSVAAGSARVAVSVDADLGPGVQEFIGVEDVVVTTDPRTAARTVALTAGTPVDKPV